MQPGVSCPRERNNFMYVRTGRKKPSCAEVSWRKIDMDAFVYDTHNLTAGRSLAQLRWNERHGQLRRYTLTTGFQEMNLAFERRNDF